MRIITASLDGMKPLGKIQWPLDGVYGKDFRTSSSFGWRTHPIEKTRKHHNGEDLIGQKYVKAFADGTVIKARASNIKKSNGEPGGYGYFVTIRHKIDGVDYCSTYAHLKKGTFQVKQGDKVQAGKILGEMGTSGASTGVHLHWEIWKGKTNGWSADGRGFVDPIEFTKALMAKQKLEGGIDLPTPDPEKEEKWEAPDKKPKYKEPLMIGSRGPEVAYLQKALGKITVDGIFGPQTHGAVLAFMNKHKDITVKDGVVGPITWSKLPDTLVKPAPKPVAPVAKPKLPKKPKLSGWLRKGSKGNDVKWVQQYLGITADGIFGPQTDKAVRAFQSKHKLKVDGIVGPMTYGKMK